VQLTILFWNLRRSLMAQAVGALVREYSVDIVGLAEGGGSADRVLGALNCGAPSAYLRAQSFCDRVTLYTRLQSDALVLRRADPWYSIQELTQPGWPSLLLVFAHLPSRTWRTADDGLLNAVAFAEAIRKAEEDAGHSRTLVIGDLNMDPFETGMTRPEALNAAMTRQIALRGGRGVGGVRYPYFYNPMWSHWGDVPMLPPATYYYDADTRGTYWHMFDQVLLRPGMLDLFGDTSVEIPIRAGAVELLSPAGTPHVQACSDHLPVLLTLSAASQRGDKGGQ